MLDGAHIAAESIAVRVPMPLTDKEHLHESAAAGRNTTRVGQVYGVETRVVERREVDRQCRPVRAANSPIVAEFRGAAVVVRGAVRPAASLPMSWRCARWVQACIAMRSSRARRRYTGK